MRMRTGTGTYLGNIEMIDVFTHYITAFAFCVRWQPS
jgi:hypothetical protein